MKTAPIIAITPCESSQVAGFGYDAKTQTLAVQFPGRGATPGSVYHYSAVPPEVFADFQASESKGKFFGSKIRGHFGYEKQPDETGTVHGLSQAQEPKYTTATKDGRIVNRATGKPIPDDEPIFILRAKDYLATAALQAYLDQIEDPEHAAAVQKRIDAFDDFAEAHPERMKQPDTAAA